MDKKTFFFNILVIFLPTVTLFFNFLSPHFVSDSRMHLIVAHNILEGLGHTYTQSNPVDISTTMSVPLGFWPPGYSCLLVPFMVIGLKSIWAIAFSDAVAIVIFYWCWYRILKITLTHSYQRVTLLVFSFFTFSFTPLGMYFAFGSNIWSLLWFSLALLQLTLIYKNNGNPPWTNLLWYHCFVFLCLFFRYSFYPVSLLLSAGLLFISYRTPGFKRVLSSLLIPLFLFGSFFCYQYSQTGDLNYIEGFHQNKKEQLHWNNLEHTTSFITNSFLFPIQYKSVIWPVSVFKLAQNSEQLNNRQIINSLLKLVFTLCISIFLSIGFYRKFRSQSNNSKRVYLLMAAVVLSQLLFFIALSLKYPPEIFRGINSVSSWTYVEEVRYFNAINLIILVAGIVVLLELRKKAVTVIFAMILVYNGWSFYKIKSQLSSDPVQNITAKNFWVTTWLPKKMIVNHAVFYEKKLEQRKSNYHFISAMYAEQGVPTLKFIDPFRLKTSKPVTLVFALDKIEEDNGDAVFKKLIVKNKAYRLGTLFSSKIEIWALEFEPGQTLNL